MWDWWHVKWGSLLRCFKHTLVSSKHCHPEPLDVFWKGDNCPPCLIFSHILNRMECEKILLAGGESHLYVRTCSHMFARLFISLYVCGCSLFLCVCVCVWGGCFSLVKWLELWLQKRKTKAIERHWSALLIFCNANAHLFTLNKAHVDVRLRGVSRALGEVSDASHPLLTSLAKTKRRKKQFSDLGTHNESKH